MQASFLVVLGVGGLRVASGDLPVSSLIAFLLYLFLLNEPISALVNGVGQLQAGLAAVVRLREVHDLPVEREPPSPGPPGLVVGGPRPRSPSATCGSVPHRDDGPWVHRASPSTCPPAA